MRFRHRHQSWLVLNLPPRWLRSLVQATAFAILLSGATACGGLYAACIVDCDPAGGNCGEPDGHCYYAFPPCVQVAVTDPITVGCCGVNLEQMKKIRSFDCDGDGDRDCDLRECYVAFDGGCQGGNPGCG